MPTYVFTYRSPTDVAAGGSEATEAWIAFFDHMGAAVQQRGNPVFESAEVGRCGAGTRLGGYSFVTADDLESAVALAKGAPVLDAGGGVEVGEVTDLHLD